MNVFDTTLWVCFSFKTSTCLFYQCSLLIVGNGKNLSEVTGSVLLALVPEFQLLLAVCIQL